MQATSVLKGYATRYCSVGISVRAQKIYPYVRKKTWESAENRVLPPFFQQTRNNVLDWDNGLQRQQNMHEIRLILTYGKDRQHVESYRLVTLSQLRQAR